MCRPISHAVFAEFARDPNKLMKNGLNRRVFNVIEFQEGGDIELLEDGAIVVAPGTYRIRGFSIVTMQTTMVPKPLTGTNYPGYAMVYPAEYEAAAQEVVLAHAISIGSPQTAYSMAPSLFEAVYTAGGRTAIAVGHQSGKLDDPVYLSVYEVDGVASDYHVFSRVAIERL